MVYRFFVIANGLASIHNLVMIMGDLFGQKLDYKGLRLAMIAILDMVIFSENFSFQKEKNCLLTKIYLA
jgi:hypothetical protein